MSSILLLQWGESGSGEHRSAWGCALSNHTCQAGEHGDDFGDLDREFEEGNCPAGNARGCVGLEGVYGGENVVFGRGEARDWSSCRSERFRQSRSMLGLQRDKKSVLYVQNLGVSPDQVRGGAKASLGDESADVGDCVALRWWPVIRLGSGRVKEAVQVICRQSSALGE